MFTRCLARTGALAVVTVVSLLAAAESARAADDAEKARIVEAKGLLKKMKALRREYDPSEAQRLLDSSVSLHNSLESRSWSGKLRDQVCKVLRDGDQPGDVRSNALSVLVRFDDPKGAYEHVRELLPSPKAEVVSALQLQAIEAAGKLARSPAIPRLIELMKKSRVTDASKMAILALGNYGRSRQRVLVLEEVLSFLKLLKPSRAPGKRVSRVTRQRWKDLGRPLVTSLNSLTGRREASADIWLELFAENKKALNRLFTRDDE